ncbi:hypothetical protein EJB05_07624, partial [Eragrostis curvula]
MFASRPMVHPLEVVAAPPPADPPAAAGQQQQQPQAQQPVPQQPQPAGEQQQEVQAAEDLPQGVLNPQGVLMKDLPGMPGTPGALGLRIAQLIFAGIALAVMTSTDDFPTVTSFWYAPPPRLASPPPASLPPSLSSPAAALAWLGFGNTLCFLVSAVILQGLYSVMLAIVDIYALMVKRCLRNRWAVRVFAVGDVITGGITLSAACAAAAITVLIDNDLDICDENHCAAFQSAVAMTFMCWFSMVPTSLLNLFSMARLR